MSSIYKRGKVWQIQFERGGKYVQRSLKTRDKAEARRMQRELDIALGHGGLSVIGVDEGEDTPVSVGDLVAAFRKHAEVYYRTPKGDLTTTYTRAHNVMKALQNQSLMNVNDFRPSTLRRIRDTWVSEGKARNTVNQYHTTVVQIFRWGVGQEMVRPETVTALEAVETLAAGRGLARETERVKPVPEADLKAVRAIATPVLRDMIDLYTLTAARPGELLALRAEDIDRSKPVWEATLAHHKTSYKGKTRTLYFGPQSQAILAPHLARCKPGNTVFPAHYRGSRLNMAIAALCKRAGVPAWTPNQLRHLAATRIRAAVNAETASVLLGHSNLSTTEIYAEKDAATARAAALAMG